MSASQQRCVYRRCRVEQPVFVTVPVVGDGLVVDVSDCNLNMCNVVHHRAGEAGVPLVQC